MDFNIQKEFFNFLNKEIKTNRVSHAYLIETNNFSDIDNFLNVLVKMLLCPNKNIENNCNKCNICNLVDSNNYPDLKIIDTDTNFIKKEQLLEVMDNFKNKSLYGIRQIYIIKDASKLNSSSGNTILKFLEEPSPNIIAILLCKNRYNVLETIISRCQIFSLKSDSDLIYEDKVNTLILALFDKNKGFLVFNEILSIIPDKKEAVKYLRIIEEYFFNIINKKENILKEDIVKFITSISDDIIYKLILIIEKYLNIMNFNVNYKLTIDNLLIEIEGVIA